MVHGATVEQAIYVICIANAFSSTAAYTLHILNEEWEYVTLEGEQLSNKCGSWEEVPREEHVGGHFLCLSPTDAGY